MPSLYLQMRMKKWPIEFAWSEPPLHWLYVNHKQWCSKEIKTEVQFFFLLGRRITPFVEKKERR